MASERLGGVKDRFKRFIGYDPLVVDAASSSEFVKSLSHDLPSKATNYLSGLFPFVRWLPHYNLQWAIGDLIAGLTVGMVVVPQSMSYAQIATLPVEYGLYSSFVGVMIYAFFATSKDVTIGPVAVMSLEVSKVIAHVREQPGGDVYSAPVIATALAFICGFIVLGVGLLRLGWLVEFIPSTAVSAFMTGSAISIAAGQVPGLLGYSNKLNTRAETFKVIINSLKHLPDTKLDAAYGLSGLVFLYVVRFTLNRVERRARNPVIKKIAFLANTLRTAVTIIILTVFAWVHLRNQDPRNYDIKILKSVPSGFRHMGQPVINSGLLSALGPLIPVSTIILLLEHIAISKSFGRVNNYKIDPNQELIAIGVTNTVGTLFAAYPATGSFSRTAIKSKAGVRTPLAGWITGIVVLVALYALTGAFYWIPSAALSAVIIHAVGDLIASPRQVYAFWKVSPLEAIIWFAGMIVTIFSSIENGIYVAVGLSGALLLYRVARPRGHFLGRVRIHDEPAEGQDATKVSQRDVYVPLRPDGVRNPLVQVEPPPPGVIIYRFDEAFLYVNAAYYTDLIADYARSTTKSGTLHTSEKPGDRPWNDPGPSRWSKSKRATQTEVNEQKPSLRAVVFDFSSVSNIDSTSVQNLVDLRTVLERYSGREVEFHFAAILSPWIKRALLAGGFGTGKVTFERPLEIAPVVPAGTEPYPLPPSHFDSRWPRSPPNGAAGSDTSSGDDKRDIEAAVKAAVEGPLVTPFTPRFHLDLSSAVAAAAGKEW